MSAEKVYAYSAYGETAVLGPDGGNALRYTGREDDQTGLYFYRARYYDSVLKQWISEDPIGIEGGLNVRAYVRGNPINRSDPLGLCDADDYACQAAAGQSSVPTSGVGALPGGPVSDCIERCMKANYGGVALGLLGFGGTFGTIPYPGNKQILGSSNPYTSPFSMAARNLGVSSIARAARVLNPYANLAAVGAASYLVALFANCSIQCSLNCAAW